MAFHIFSRFYGESHPTEDMSVKNLAYLTSEQALADIANFVTAMNNEYVIKINFFEILNHITYNLT